MGAPISVYKSNSLKTMDVDNISDVTMLMSPLQTDKSTMMSRFYLDGLFSVNLSDGTDGVIGYCQIGSANYHMHSGSRRGNLRIYDGGDCLLFNDAGLNTLAYGSISQILTTHANHIKVITTFSSSFYSGSTERGYQVKGNDNIWYTHVSENTTIPPQGVITTTDIVNTVFETAQTIAIRPYIINEEGTHYGAVQSFFGTDPIVSLDAQMRGTPCTAGTNMSFYMRKEEASRLDSLTNTGQNSGIFGYLDDQLTQPLLSGYYAIGSNPLSVTNGMFTHWVYCAPPVAQKDLTIYVEQVMDEYENVSYTASATLNNGFRDFPVTISGEIGAYNQNDNQISGNSGNGSFYMTIDAGTNGAYQTTKFNPSPDAAYCRATNLSISPRGLSFETPPG